MTVLFALSTVAAFADNVDGDYTYTVNLDGVSCTVTGYTNAIATDITIPTTLDGFTVTKIGEYAFSENTTIAGVTVPSGVTVIGGHAFYACVKLKSISLPNTIGTIGAYAFVCNRFESINISDSVQSIGDYAFNGCDKLVSLTLPGSITNKARNVFEACSSLKNVIMMNGFNSLGDNMFQNCGELESVVIPDSVTTIGHEAFTWCVKLKSISIPASVTSIGYSAFNHCDTLETVNLSNGLLQIDYGAFSWCKKLKSIFIPASVTLIGDTAFQFTPAQIYFLGNNPNPSDNAYYLLYPDYKARWIAHKVTATGFAYGYKDNGYPKFSYYCYPFFTITVNSAAHGSVSAGIQNGYGIETLAIPLTISPEDGYTPDSLSCTYGSTAAALSLTATSFTMPKGDVQITAVFVPIALPSVAVTSSTADTTPTWTFTHANSGPFRWRFDNSSPWTTTPDSSYTPTAPLSDGTYTLHVEEQDGNGYWSLPASASVVIDTTAPTVTLRSPTGTTVPASTANIVLAFNKTVTDVLGKTVTVNDGTSDYVYTVSPSGIYISGTGTSCQATIPVSAFKKAGVSLALSYGTPYTVKIAAGTYLNEAAIGNTANANVGSFTTVVHHSGGTVTPDVIIQPDYAGGKVRVTLSYGHKDYEDPNKVVAYFTTSESAIKTIEPYCVYNPTTAAMTIRANPMYSYTVGYNDISFNDVTSSGWYKHYVDFIAAREIVKGFGNGIFGPDQNITRAQFVMILKNLAGDKTIYTTTSFSDVTATSWYSGAVEWAYENNIVYGSNGRFDPDAKITRQDISVMIARYAEKYEGYTFEKTTAAVTFTDSGDIAAYASGAVSTMQQAGILAGPGDGTFKPRDNATRAEAAKMIDVLIRDMVK